MINTCTVKSPSQAGMASLIRAGQALGIPLVVAGCVPQGDKKATELEGLSLLGVAQIDRVVEVVEETLRGNTVRLLGKKRLPRLDLPKVRRWAGCEWRGKDTVLEHCRRPSGEFGSWGAGRRRGEREPCSRGRRACMSCLAIQLRCTCNGHLGSPSTHANMPKAGKPAWIAVRCLWKVWSTEHAGKLPLLPAWAAAGQAQPAHRDHTSVHRLPG